MFRFIVILLLIFGCSQVLAQNIIISEIMADPTPSHGLPEKEYVEIYNTSNGIINLKNYKFSYESTIVSLADSVIYPHSYMILCKKGNEIDFKSYGRVMGLNSLSLLNTLATLKIFNESENFTVKYSVSWYSENKTQGYSLEMIDLNFSCVGQKNWASSVSVLGGTPGQVNSVSKVNPDTSGPRLLSSDLVDLQQINLVFDEDLSFPTMANFSILNLKYQIAAIKFDVNNFQNISLILNTKLNSNEELILKIEGLQDCSKNVMETSYANFYNLQKAVHGDILISEVLFNPNQNGQDFVEIYNNSGRKLNLKEVTISNIDNKGMLNFKQISKTDWILFEEQYLAITIDTASLQAIYPSKMVKKLFQIGSLPAFNIDKGTVVIANSSKIVLDSMVYLGKMHNKNLTNFKGVSLERVSFTKPTNAATNWKSSSSLNHYATPGYINSEQELDISSNEVYLEPIVFNPSHQNQNNFTSLYFNLAQGENFVDIDIYNRNGKLVRKLMNNQLIGTKSEITWDGTDNSGMILPVGYYVFKININTNQKIESFILKAVVAN